MQDGGGKMEYAALVQRWNGSSSARRNHPVDVPDSARSMDQRLVDGWRDGRLRQALLPATVRRRALEGVRQLLDRQDNENKHG